jgi:hypothetical protein
MCLFELAKIADQEHHLAELLSRAMQTARNGHTVSRADWRLTKERNAHQLSAVNKDARIAWGKGICREVETCFDINERRLHPCEPVYFLTLVDLACCTAHDVESVNLDFIKVQLRYGLKGLSYIGMIEPAYYVNIAPGTHVQTKRLVSWHLHAIAWGKSKRGMKRLISRLNRMRQHYRAIADDFKGARFCTVRQNTLPKTLGYILKPPANSYRIASWWRRTKEGKKRYTFKSNKGRMRPGERVTAFHLMKYVRLDELAMAGGDGARVLRRAKQRVHKLLGQ